MNAALQEKNVYEDFEPRNDILFFKVGTQGLISFHGRNYNIKKRLSTEERSRLVTDSTFFQVSSGCYVNITNISAMSDDHLLFQDSTKQIPCSKRKQQLIRQLLAP